MLILAKQDVKIARGHIWGLKQSLRADLTPPLLEVLTRGRKGEFSEFRRDP